MHASVASVIAKMRTTIDGAMAEMRERAVAPPVLPERRGRFLSEPVIDFG